ncbi:MAG: metal-dependent transcriptional regulator [Candidatus Nanoarchaeia archaeon]
MDISKEDYLRVMYELGEDKIRSVSVADRLDISKSSVSQMIKKLQEEKLVVALPYSKITLTKKGREEGKRITHNHNVIVIFLKKVLGLKGKSVNEEAHLLEHAFSQEGIDKLNRFLKDKGYKK